MKAMNLTTGLVLVMLVSACSTSRLAGPGVYYDDVYYVPGATRDNINQAFSPVPAISKDAKKAGSRDFEMQQREYQKTRNSGEQDTRDFAALQEQYAALLSDDSLQEVDTLIYYNDETGYWVGGFDGSTMDRDYAERMIRFHGPFIRIPYYSPVYSEIVYFNHYDWNVYVDGNYAYAFPTWTNRWYSSFYYNSWGYPRWSIGMSWGYPYYNYWGFGYGWYDPFYYSFYSPYYYSHWHYPYYRHPYYYGGGYYSGHNPKTSNRTYYSGMRSGLSSNTRSLASTSFNSREILKRTSGERVEVTNSGTRISRDQQGNTRYETEGGTVYTRTARGGASQEGLKSGTTASETPTRTGTVQQGNTRRSYTPSYSKPEDNSRPTYNRTSYTRVSGDSRNPQTTGTVQSTNTGTRQVQSGASTPTRNTNVNSGSSSTRSTVTPSNTRSSSTTTYQQGSSTSTPRSSTYTAPSRSSSSNSSTEPSRSSGSSSSSSRSSVSSGSSSSSSSSGSSSSSSSSSSSGGGTVRQGRR